MTTTTVPISITCPDWCPVAAEQHAAELWDNGGECFHHMEHIVVDPTGIQGPMVETRKCNPIELRLSTATGPDGHEVEAPIVYIETASEHSLDQALAVADAIRDMVKQYRAAGRGRMGAAVLALLAEVIAGQERLAYQLAALQHHVDEKLIEERMRVQTIADLVANRPEPEGLTVVRGAKT